MSHTTHDQKLLIEALNENGLSFIAKSIAMFIEHMAGEKDMYKQCTYLNTLITSIQSHLGYIQSLKVYNPSAPEQMHDAMLLLKTENSTLEMRVIHNPLIPERGQLATFRYEFDKRHVMAFVAW